VLLRDLGRAEYSEAHAEMLRTVDARRAGTIEDTVLLVEHPHIFTRGRKSRDLSNVLDAGDVPVVAVERGGDITYHGPGQLVIYPVFALLEGERDAPRFIRRLEGWVMDTMARLGVVDGERRPGFSGVWCRGKKVASVGVAVTADWITWHGIALNVRPDLSYFTRINPCGMQAGIMTSLEVLAGRSISMEEAREALKAEL
jgi:lipoyl(octanoyl) transferase